MVFRERDIAKTSTGWPPRRSGAIALALAAAVALAALAAGCGGSSGQGVAKLPSTKSTDNSKSSSGGSGRPNAMAYSACMRKNGVAEFPDPDSSGHILLTSSRSANGHKTGVDVDSPQFKKAQQACQSLQPNGGRPTAQQQAQAQQAMLKYAACMRSHGVPRFPDPKAGGALSIGKNGGVDPNTAAFKSAAQACHKIVPGSPLIAPPSATPPGGGHGGKGSQGGEEIGVAPG
jgi:hypothetical protein